jgi:putative oxidoreductase
MSIYESAPGPWRDRMLAVFRIVAGVVFISAGTMKLFGWPPAPGPMPPIPLFSETWFAGVLETFGGALIVLGLFTRPVAFILAGEMAVAYFQFHFPTSPYPTVNMGIPAIMYCFFFLYLAAAGAGAWSVDGAIARSRTQSRRSANPAGAALRARAA